LQFGSVQGMSAKVLLVACKCPHHEGVGKGDKMKMDEVGGAYDTWERQEMPTEYWEENLKEGACSEDLGVVGRLLK